MEAPEIRWRGFILPGKNMAPHAAASAKAILAFQSDTVIEAALSEELPQFTSNTTTKRTQILQDYEQVKQQGYATCIGEIDELLAAVAVPIRIPHLGVIYSLGLTGPLKRLVSKDLKLLAGTMTVYAERIAESLATGLGCRGTLD
jgi:DNA-binding IclR family transcriptional regulator